jgi:glycosyltransferase involved in cell wall biosynthesis
MSISVIIPAYDEELYIARTIRAILAARDYLQAKAACPVEILVVNNGSRDGTASVAGGLGAVVLFESNHNIACVRNRGAKAASGDVLVFIDADTWVPEPILLRIHQLTGDRQCLGGAADTLYTPRRKSIALYLGIWRVVGKLANLAQGPLQFCRKDVFFAIHGYNESLLMGEDVDLFSRLRRYAKRVRGHVTYIVDLRVRPSARRFDRWPLWRTLLFTNPLFIGLFSRVPRAWAGWYGDAPR